MSTPTGNGQVSEQEREVARRQREETEVTGRSERSGSGNTLGDGSSSEEGENSQES